MTSPLPVPAAKAATGTNYTHRTWVDEMAVALGLVAGIYRDFEVMGLPLASPEVQAGKSQLAGVVDCRTTALEVMRNGVRLVEETDARYVPVFEAIQSVGGVDEVAKGKHYHDRRS